MKSSPKRINIVLACLCGIMLLLTITPNGGENPDKISPNSGPRVASEREISFSGYSWIVRPSNSEAQGPGPNYFSNSTQSVWVDTQGRLHLKIRQEGDKWLCAEVYTTRSFGYGYYQFQLAPGFEDLGVNVVVGLFTYLNDTAEIDVEFARWGQTGDKAGQYVVQPGSRSGNLRRFEIAESGLSSTHAFLWCKKYIQFKSVWGTNLSVTGADVIHEWTYTGRDNPNPSTERVHMNLWLMKGLAPTNAQEAEIIVEKFQFSPSPCPVLAGGSDIPGFPVWAILVCFGLSQFIIRIYRPRR